jgi:lipopolysaccharide exporter
VNEVHQTQLIETHSARVAGTRSGLERGGASLTRRVLRAGAWTFLFRAAARGIGFVRNIALARILAPDDIGLFGIVLVIFSIVERFSETGFESALVQKKEEIGLYLDTAWTVLAARRIILAAAVLAAAPLIASFFGEARAAPLIQVLGISILIQAFGNVAVVQFQRELEVRRQYAHLFSGTLADLTVSIALAVYLQSAWALMYGLVANRLVSVTASYLVHPYRPRIRLDWEQVRDLSRFGRWVFAKNILTFFAYRGDNLVVGKVLGAPALGLYMLAYSISEVVTVEVSRVTNNVAFPAYARKQGERDRIRTAFLAATELIASVSLPIAVGIAFVAEPITLALLGERWLEVASILPPLAFAGCVRAIISNGNAVSAGLGFSQHGFQWGIVQIVAMYTSMYPLMSSFGLVGLSYAVLIGALAPTPLFVRNSKLLLDVGSMALVRALTPACALACVTVGVLLATGAFEDTIMALMVRLGLVGVSVTAASVILWYWKRIGPLTLIMLLWSEGGSAVQGSPHPGNPPVDTG